MLLYLDIYCLLFILWLEGQNFVHQRVEALVIPVVLRNQEHRLGFPDYVRRDAGVEADLTNGGFGHTGHRCQLFPEADPLGFVGPVERLQNTGQTEGLLPRVVVELEDGTGILAPPVIPVTELGEVIGIVEILPAWIAHIDHRRHILGSGDVPRRRFGERPKMDLLHVPPGLAPGAGHWIAGPMNDQAVDDALTPRAAVGEHRVPAEDRILRPGASENKLLAVNGNHRVLKGEGGL